MTAPAPPPTAACARRSTAPTRRLGSTPSSFAIPGAGPHTISPSTPLPIVSDPAIIDATTQPGSNCSTGLKVELDGTNVTGTDPDGLAVSAGSTTIRGFVINRFSFPGRGIYLFGAGGNAIECNWIGTNVTGATASGNFVGISIDPPSTGNIIGGLTAAERNVIAASEDAGLRISAANTIVQGNYIGTNRSGTAGLGAGTPNGLGIFVNGPAESLTVGGTSTGARNIISGNGSFGILVFAFNTTIHGNYIGLNAAGNAAVPNGGSGVGIGDARGTTLGGLAAGAGNVISGNDGYGVWIRDGGALSSGNVVAGNIIGQDAAESVAIGNDAGGVLLFQNASGTRKTTIGGTAAGAGNHIANNGGPGVTVTGASSTDNSILGNSIHGNAGLGIDLGADGVTANDLGDGDAGPNDFQNSPVLTSATPGAAGEIAGSLNSAASTSYRVEFFKNATCDPSGFGEGGTFLGAQTYTTDGSGNAPISFDPSVALTNGDDISATATSPSGDTSEFSGCRQVQPAPDCTPDGGDAGDIQTITPPTSVAEDALQSNTCIRFFHESTNVALTSDLAADLLPRPNSLYDSPVMRSGVVPAGVVVDSHFLHADSISNAVIHLEGTVTFEQDIIAVIFRDGTLHASEAAGVGLKAAGTTYGTQHAKPRVGDRHRC